MMKLHIDEGIQIADFAAVLRRRWRFVVFCTAGVLTVAAIMTWRQEAVYKATSRIMIGQTLVRAILPEQTNPYESYFSERLTFETQLHVIKSDPVAERVVRRLALVSPEASEETFKAASMRVKSAITVNRLPDTRLFNIHVVDPDPARARDIANATAEVYIELNDKRKIETTQKSVAWLTEELNGLEKKIRGLEEELIDYLQETNVGAPGVLAIDSGRRGEDTIMTSQTSRVQALTNQLTGAEIELNQLLQRYLDKHPKVMAKRAEIVTLKEKIHNDVEESAAQNKHLIQYNIKRRESELNKEMMILLMKKLKEMDLTGGLSESIISIVEYAQLPSQPISPNRKRNMIIGGLLGLLMGTGVAFYLEIFDRTVQNAEDAERFIKAPVLATIINVEGNGRPDDAFTIVARQPAAPESEMFRTLRANIKFSRPDGSPKTLLVTSTGPEEGKSTVSSNLGITLASSAKRTVIVDSDLRKPRMHKIFDLKNVKGMVELLVGEAEIEDVVQPTSIENLFVIPRGSLPPNPAELLDSDSLKEVVSKLREQFDFVIFDSPPVGTVIDASLLGGLVDGTILVVEAGKFEWRPILQAKGQIEKARGRVLGIVINKSKREHQGYYHYYQQYVVHNEAQGSSASA